MPLKFSVKLIGCRFHYCLYTDRQDQSRRPYQPDARLPTRPKLVRYHSIFIIAGDFNVPVAGLQKPSVLRIFLGS